MQVRALGPGWRTSLRSRSNCSMLTAHGSGLQGAAPRTLGEGEGEWGASRPDSDGPVARVVISE